VPHLRLRPTARLSTFRRIALGTWRDAYDPSVYGSLTLRMDAALAYIEAFRAATGRRITVSHLMCKALAAALEAMPDANAILRFHRPYTREDIGIFFQVALEDARNGTLDLSGARIADPQKKSLVEIVDELEDRFARVKAHQDTELEQTRETFRRVPLPLMFWLTRLTSFLAYTLNLDMRWAGMPRDPFGSAMITNIGSLGLDEAYVPLVPYSRVPLLLAVGAVRAVPLVERDEIRIGRVMRVHATFDHRLLDGSHAAVLARVITAHMERPFEHFDPLPDESPPPAGR
jgi:pyruvate/2-oxoglutarate dehydrogenase complex dihydrolipoamide acyltransferase (E2) component